MLDRIEVCHLISYATYYLLYASLFKVFAGLTSRVSLGQPLGKKAPLRHTKLHSISHFYSSSILLFIPYISASII
jgi:hypothetical protein